LGKKRWIGEDELNQRESGVEAPFFAHYAT